MRRLLYLAFLAALLAPQACGNRTVPEEDASACTDTVLYARGFRIRYCDGYTSVTVRDPWDTLRIRHTYLLVDKAADVPDNLPEGTLIRTPVERAAVYSSVHCAVIEQMGCTGSIVGVCEPEYITSGSILSGISSGSIRDLGSSTAPDVETILDIGTDVIIASPFENSGYGAAEKLGIPIVEAADYMENHPLGRTEWCRFYGLLFGRKAVADSIFNATARRYNDLKALAATATSKPSVLLERKYGAAWPVPSGNSYIGILHEDAGGDYLFRETAGAAITSLPFEKVFDTAVNADLWLFKYNAPKPWTYSDLEKEYAPYAGFEAFKEGRVFACNTGATTYYDDLTLYPDRILEDFIILYHPELLPGRRTRYYLPLQK